VVVLSIEIYIIHSGVCSVVGKLLVAPIWYVVVQEICRVIHMACGCVVCQILDRPRKTTVCLLFVSVSLQVDNSTLITALLSCTQVVWIIKQ
jgi:hypothetical protein